MIRAKGFTKLAFLCAGFVITGIVGCNEDNENAVKNLATKPPPAGVSGAKPNYSDQRKRADQGGAAAYGKDYPGAR